MKSKFIILSSTIIILTALSCTDDFQEINTDPLGLDQNAVDANPSLQGQAFAFGQYRTVAGNFQTAQNLFSDLWCQYYATTNPGFRSDRYVQIGGWANGAWRNFYQQAMPQLKYALDITEETENEVGNAMAKIWWVHGFHRITDYWGPIPYFEAGNGEVSVRYDSQESIYNDFFVKLDEAVSQLKANPGGESFVGTDRLYNGNGDKWLKFANSLRLRLAIRIRFVEPEKARLEAEKAIQDGVITDNVDIADILTDDINRHPLDEITQFGEFRMSAAMESYMEGYEDPRLPNYFSPAVGGDTDGDGSPYEGLLNGQLAVDLEGPDTNANHSDVAMRFMNLALGGSNPDFEVMNAAEVYFLRAEGALLGWNMNGSSQELYEEGIRKSMQQNNVSDNAGIEAYINSNNIPIAYEDGADPVANIPVTWAGDSETQLEQIITQKWISLFPNGWEAWAELRRTGFPRMYTRVASNNADVAVDEVVSRLVYVNAEFNRNTEAVEAAVISPEIGGNDSNNTKVWWDKRN